jgi:hypothetical protein
MSEEDKEEEEEWLQLDYLSKTKSIMRQSSTAVRPRRARQLASLRSLPSVLKIMLPRCVLPALDRGTTRGGLKEETAVR